MNLVHICIHASAGFAEQSHRAIHLDATGSRERISGVHDFSQFNQTTRVADYPGPTERVFTDAMATIIIEDFFLNFPT
jgi:hypothetical protein